MKRFRSVFLAVFLSLVVLFATSYILYYLFKSANVKVEEVAVSISTPIKEEPNVDIEEEHITPSEIKISLPDAPTFSSVTLKSGEVESVKIEPISVVVEEKSEIEVVVPSEPTFVNVTVKEMSPPPPILFEPTVRALKEPIIFSSPITPVYDDDFFADFVDSYDDFALFDGIYYYTLYIMDERYGDIEVLIENGFVSISKDDLLYYISELVTDSAYNRIKALPGDYLLLDDLINIGIDAYNDDFEFAIYLYFSIDDMPERILSLASSTTGRERFSLSGASELKKAFFSLASSYNIHLAYDRVINPDYNYYYGSLTASNYATIGDLNLDYYYSINIKKDSPLEIKINSYRFYYDFLDHDIRLSFGNVFGFGLGNSTGSFGIQFEKNYNFGNGSAKKNNHEEVIEITDDSRIIVESSGRKIYERTVSPGIYRIRDFTFDQGVNEVVIYVAPLYLLTNPEEYKSVSKVYTFSFAYDSQLLAYGDTLYGGSLTIGTQSVKKETPNPEGSFSIPSILDKKTLFLLKDLSLSYFQDFGLSDHTTLQLDFALAKRPHTIYEYESIATFDALILNANRLGTTTYSTNLRFDTAYKTPIYGLKLSHRFLIGNKYFSSLSSTLDYKSSEKYNELSLNLSFGGSIGLLRYNISSSTTIRDFDPTNVVWRVNGAFSYTLFKKLNLTTSISANYNPITSNKVQFLGQLSASFSFNKAGVSYSSDYFKSNNISISSPIGKDQAQLYISSLKLSDPKNHNLAASYAHTNDLFTVGTRFQAYDKYNHYGANISISTASYFVNGNLNFSNSARDNFLIIKPKGILKKGIIEVAKSSQASGEVVDKRLGTVLYAGLNARSRNNLIIYVSGDNEFLDTKTFAYEINGSNRGGYYVPLVVPDSYTVSAVLENGYNFSSPVYRVEVDEESGKTTYTEIDSLYLFCDTDGRFILSDVEVGTYIFDYNYQDKWYAIEFTIENQEKEENRVIVFDDFLIESLINYDDEDAEILYPDYDGHATLTGARGVNNEDFWSQLFPSFE